MYCRFRRCLEVPVMNGKRKKLTAAPESELPPLPRVLPKTLREGLNSTAPTLRSKPALMSITSPLLDLRQSVLLESPIDRASNDDNGEESTGSV